MKFPKIRYPMDKKGVIGVGIVVLLVILVGTIGTYKAFEGNQYIVDISTGTIYDLTKCLISNLNQSNLVYLSDLNVGCKVFWIYSLFLGVFLNKT